MPRFRVLYRLKGLLIAVGLVLLLGAADASWKVSTTFAALSLTDVLLTGVGLLVAVMTGAAGVLIAADVRADMATAQAWHEIHAETVVFATPAETAATDRVDALYVVAPQDEGLRRVLLAHRFMVPAPPPNGIGSLAPERCGARAVPAGASIKPDVQAVRTVSAEDGLGERLTASAAAQRKLGPQLISSNAMSVTGRTRNDAVRKVSAPKRVANAGKRWDWPAFATATTSRVPGSDCGYIEIVLADRHGRDKNPAPSEVAPEPETTVQPCCRGPPLGKFRPHVADRAGHLGKPFRETDRSRAISPAEFVVTDNLGDPVSICAAELDVLEAYLDDLLRDVLGSADTATKPT